MEGKLKTNLMYSRGKAVCNYCGKSMNRLNLKRHTLEYHKGQAVSERIV